MQEKLDYHEIDLHQQWSFRLRRDDSRDYLVIQCLPPSETEVELDSVYSAPTADISEPSNPRLSPENPVTPQRNLRTFLLGAFRNVPVRDMKYICFGFLGAILEYSEISKLDQPEMSQEFIAYLDREESLAELQDYLSKNHPNILKKAKQRQRSPGHFQW